DCGLLTQTYATALAAAQAFNACMNSNPCTGPQLLDACGCPVVLNGLPVAADEVAAAQAAYKAFVAAGCPITQCDVPCPPRARSGYARRRATGIATAIAWRPEPIET